MESQVSHWLQFQPDSANSSWLWGLDDKFQRFWPSCPSVHPCDGVDVEAAGRGFLTARPGVTLGCIKSFDNVFCATRLGCK